ncbi:MAG: XisI protein [Spirulina sp. DLM2.Bin59]|nr:MAG: XisI protein [Spirulina sp. DLM2.Bin59]
MESLAQYRTIVQRLLLDYAQVKPAYGEIEVEPIFDPERDHYQVLHLGWQGKQWVHSTMIHIDLRDGKVWLQWNATERDLAAELVQAGIQAEDIVLGFHSPFMRQFSGYGVG